MNARNDVRMHVARHEAVHRHEPLVTNHQSRITNHRVTNHLVEIMPDVPDLPRPSQLWKQLAPERKLQAAEAFWRDEHAAMEQAEAVAMIAQRIKFRVKSVATMPLDKKSRQLAAVATVS